MEEKYSMNEISRFQRSKTSVLMVTFYLIVIGTSYLLPYVISSMS